jgi:hypothetical protein
LEVICKKSDAGHLPDAENSPTIELKADRIQRVNLSNRNEPIAEVHCP